MPKFTRAEIRKIIGENCTDEMENSIIALHLGVVDPLKDDVAKYKADSDKLEEVQKELNVLKAKPAVDYEEKYNSEHKAFENYKKEVVDKATRAAKETAVRNYFQSKNITGTNLEIAMRGASEEIGAIELDGEKIKDTAALDALIGGTFAGLVVTKTVQGVQTANPPANNGGSKLTKADIFKKDDHGRYVMSTSERQKALAENPELMKG